MEVKTDLYKFSSKNDFNKIMYRNYTNNSNNALKIYSSIKLLKAVSDGDKAPKHYHYVTNYQGVFYLLVCV